MTTRARTQEAKLQKRRQLLDAAKELFFEHGYQNTTIGMITKRAGESTGTFYLYFKNKRDIYVTLFADGIDIYRNMVKEAISPPGMSTLDRLAAIAYAYYRFYMEYAGYFDILAFMMLHDAELKERSEKGPYLDAKAIELLKIIEGVINDGIDSGELMPMDTWNATNALWGMMDGLIMLAERKNVMVMGVSLEDLFKQTLAILFYGMAKREHPPKRKA